MATIDYIRRVIDVTDHGADCLSFGAILGFLSFVSLFGLFGLVFVAHAFFPARVQLDAGAFAGATVALGGAYATVLGATTAAFRFGGRDGHEERH